MKTKIKLMALVAGLLSILPTTSAWAGGDTFYYAKATAVVSSTGGGKVYASSTSVTSPDSQCTGTTSTSEVGKSAKNTQSVTLYRYAKANDGFEFKGWSTADNADISTVTDTSTSVTVAPSATSESDANNYTYYAYFAKLKLSAFGITFETSDAGTYTVGGGAPANMTGLTEATSVVLASSDSNFLNWKVNDAVVNDNPYTATCIADTTIGAEFLTADQVAEATTLAEVTAALANNGKKKITIPAGTKIVMESGTIAVPDGKQLVVDGELWMDGGTLKGTVIVNGTLSKCTKLIRQTGDGDEPFNPYSGDEKYQVKYWKTASSTPSVTISGVTASSHLTIINGLGEVVYRGASASAYVCTTDKSVAINHITGVKASYSSGTDAYNAVAKNSHNVSTTSCSLMGNAASQLVLLTANGTVDVGSSNPLNSGFIADCAGCTLSFTSKQFGNEANVIVLNASTVTSSKLTNARLTAINCTTVTGAGTDGINSNQTSYYTSLHLYDCGSFSKFNFSKSNVIMEAGTPGVCFFSGGPYGPTFTGNYHVYGGKFSKDPSGYLASKELEAPKDGNYWVVRVKAPTVNVAKVGTDEYESIQAAVDAASSGSTVELLTGIVAQELEAPVTVPVGKTVTIDLAGCAITAPNGAIINHGTLYLQDTSTFDVPGSLTTVNGNVIVNDGMLDITWGAYNGNIVLNGGIFTTHFGTFDGTLSVASGLDPKVVANLRGGEFSQSVAPFLRDGYSEVYSRIAQSDPMRYWVYQPQTIVTETEYSNAEKAWKLEFMTSSDLQLYKKTKNRDDHSSDADWRRRAELYSYIQPYSHYVLDCALIFDRVVANGTVTFYGKTQMTVTEAIDRDLLANEDYAVLARKISEFGATPFSYGRSIDEVGSVIAGVADNKAGNNVGTVCTVDLRVCTQSKNTVGVYDKFMALVDVRYMLGGKKAAIDRDNGRVAFDSLTEAVAAAQNGETILLGADCAENVTLEKVGTFTIDPYGFKFTGSVSIGEGLEEGAPATTSDSLVVAQDVPSAPATTYVLKLSKVTVGIPAVANTTLAVTASEGEVTNLGNGQYQVAPGATVTAMYTPNEGYFGNTIEKTIASASNGATVTVTDEEAASVKAIVAKIGEAPYASLAEAIEAAAESGETIDVVKESTLTVVEGVELTVTAGQLVAAVPADNVLELKDGTDATLAWPTAEGAADHIIVTGGRYSADPSKFLADGLEAKKVGEKYVVGVKIVSGDTETETIVTTEKQESKVEKLEETEKAEVFKDVDVEEVAEVVGKIEQNTKVEGVKLTVKDTEQKPAGIVAVVEEATKQDEDFAEAVKSAAEVSVKVEVEVKPTEYVAPSEQAQSNTGKVAFKLTPKATVTVVKEAKTLTQTVPVTNDMIDQNQKIAVSIYTGFRPATILHTDDDGALIESFSGEQIVYDAENGVATVQISHFSTLLASQEEIDVERDLLPETVRETATKVTSGFYQNATTYQVATEFYITSKAGLEYFRDLVNSYDAAYATYAEGGFWTGTRKTFYGYGKENFLFKDKVIKLCADIDLGNEEWDPIGNEKKSDGTSRTEGLIFYIYGAFDGQNHTISNLKINTETLADKDGAGLFGRVAENASFRNLTICNVDIYAKSYVGVLCGNCGSGSGVIVIDNVHVAGKISVNGYGYVGGLVGHGCYSISNSSVVGNNGTGDAGKVISRYWQVGGIAGTGRSYSGVGITNCRVENIDMEVYYYEAGGIVGRAYSDVKNCVVEKVTIGAYNGSSRFDASQCGMITANAHQGGIIVTENSPKEPGQCASITDNVIVGWNIVGSIAEAGITGGTFENIPATYIASGYEKIAQGTTPETWVVQEAAPPELQGSGTAADPWQIWTLADLKTFRDNVNANGKYCNGFVSVFADIDLGGVEWTPIGTGSNGSGAFYGTFDGQDHVISNLKINSTENNVGLFGYAGYSERGGTIKNLTIENAEVKGANDVAALAGYFHVMTLIENVHVIGTVKIEATAADVGGIVGKTAATPVIKNCSVVATPESGAYIKARTSGSSASAGGMIGFAGGEGWTCEIRDCFVANIDFTSYNRIGGIAGSLQRPSGYGSVDMYVTGCKVSNVTVTVTGPSNATLSNRHDAQAGLIVGCPAGSGSRNKHHYSDNTYAGTCSVTATSGATDIIPTQLYGLWALGYSRASDIGQTWGAPVTGDADIVPEITIGGADYRTFLKGYKVAGATGSSEDNPFVLHTDVGYTLLAQDRIYVRADGNIFYPRTDLGRAIRSVDCGDGVTLYYVAPEGGVCKIGDRIYETLADALREAKSTDTVVLTADATMPTDSGVSPVCKIDMAGFALSVPDDPAYDGKIVDSANAAQLLGYVVENGVRAYSHEANEDFKYSGDEAAWDSSWGVYNIYLNGYAAVIEAQSPDVPAENIKITYQKDGVTHVALYNKVNYPARIFSGWKYPKANFGVDSSTKSLTVTVKSGTIEGVRASSKVTSKPTEATLDSTLASSTVNVEGGEVGSIVSSWNFNQSIDLYNVNVSGGKVGAIYGNGQTDRQSAFNHLNVDKTIYVPVVKEANITITGGEVETVYGGGYGNMNPKPTDSQGPWTMETQVANITVKSGVVGAIYGGGQCGAYGAFDKVIVDQANITISGGCVGSVVKDAGVGSLAEVKSATATLTGGIYTTKPDATYIAVGCEAASNLDAATKDVYPWRVQEKTVTTDDGEPIVIDIAEKPEAGEPDVKVPITVTQELAKEILGASTDVTKPLTEAQVTEIVTQLEEKGDDGMTGWQKYTAGFSQTDKHPLAPKGKGTEDGKLVLVTSLIAPKQLSVDTGVKVKYILKKATKVNPTTGVPDDRDFAAVQELPTPEFPVDVTTLDPETYWKIDVEYTATRVVETPVNPGN